jgi:hypothetical protein
VSRRRRGGGAGTDAREPGAGGQEECQAAPLSSHPTHLSPLSTCRAEQHALVAKAFKGKNHMKDKEKLRAREISKTQGVGEVEW